MESNKKELDMIKFMERFNDIVYFAVDENKKFSIDEFYQSCENKTLIEKLENFWFNLPEDEENREKYLELVCNEFDETKSFDNWWYALLYYTLQGIISYFETNYMK